MISYFPSTSNCYSWFNIKYYRCYCIYSTLFSIYENRHRIYCGICSKTKENQIGPTEVMRGIGVNGSSPHTNITIEPTAVDAGKEETLIEDTRANIKQEIMATENASIERILVIKEASE